VANEPEVYQAAGLEMRPDAREGAGALGGILTALYWARERGAEAALVVACDMPFVSVSLLRALLSERETTAENEAAGMPPDVVAPESGGRRGVEPLCALYAVACIEPIERALDRGDLRVISFFGDVVVRALPLEQVRAFGEPAVLFMNVNTPEERERAEQIAAGLASGARTAGTGREQTA
ncbi:MAG TPA: molybdenum cofactor guanylyltransferase, partial [Longimicrobiales bacterium]